MARVRIVLQRVTSACVSVDGAVVGRIEPQSQGLVALVGVTHSDTEATAHGLADKMWSLRILDEQLSASDVNAPILVISQFTLYADTRKGRRPSWNAAASGEHAEPLVQAVVDRLRAHGATVATGMFGAHMHVELTNDGPVTVILDA